MADPRSGSALVTGASDGLGWHIAHHLVANRKYHGLLTTRNPRKLAKLCHDTGITEQVTILAGDVSRRHHVDELAKLITDSPVNVLVNNASGWFEGPLGLMASAEIQDLINATLSSSLLVTRIVSEHMNRRACGDIIFLGSICGTDLRPSLNTAFNAAKWGIRGLAKTLRREYKDTGIRVSLLSLGRIEEGDEIPGGSEETSPIEAVLCALDFILAMPRRAVVDELVITPTRRDY